MKYSLLSLLLLVTVLSVTAQPAPPTADDVLKEAYKQAAKEKKKVLVMFHASWCIWCHRMDSSMNDASCKKFFDDNFVIRHLVVDEAKDKVNLENPGANELRAKYHGDGLGIPFWLMLDKDGNLLSDSKMRKEGEGPEQGENIGCPAAIKEVDFFIGLLKRTTPLTGDQLEIIRKRFRQNDK